MAGKTSSQSTPPAAEKAKGRVGAPSAYTPDLGERICALLAEGMSLRRICQQQGMPDKATVLRWASRTPEFRDQYARAREVAADALVDEALAIADDASEDIEQVDSGDGVLATRVNHEHIHRSKLRVQVRQWMAARLNPRKYGDRVAHDFSDPEGKPLAPTLILQGVDRAKPAPKAGARVRKSRD
jgi:hypothetical protein